MPVGAFCGDLDSEQRNSFVELVDAKTLGAARTDDGHVIGLSPALLYPAPPATRHVRLKRIEGLDDVQQIVGGHDFVCARSSDGTVHCWGANDLGQLGDGTIDPKKSPVSVSFLGGHAAQIAAAEDTACALLVDGRVKCWGSNLNHALGDGSTDAYRTSPVEVTGAKGALWIAMGGTSACVGMPAGRVRCWGNNFDGQLGDGTFESRSTPTDAIALQGAHAMALGDDAGCALFDHDVPKCWGSLAVDGRVPTVLDLSSIAPASPP